MQPLSLVSSYEIIGGSKFWEFWRCKIQKIILHKGFTLSDFTRDDEPPMWLFTPWSFILSFIWCVMACHYKMLLLHKFSCDISLRYPNSIEFHFYNWCETGFESWIQCSSGGSPWEREYWVITATVMRWLPLNHWSHLTLLSKGGRIMEKLWWEAL